MDTTPVTERFHPGHGLTINDPAKILLAEDDAEMRALVASALRGDGYEVVDVPDGGRLLVRLAAAYNVKSKFDAYDLLVTDIRMPVVNGLQIVEGLRRAGWRIPIIVMTAFGDSQTRERAERLEAILFDKPFDIDDLRTAIVNVLTYRYRG